MFCPEIHTSGAQTQQLRENQRLISPLKKKNQTKHARPILDNLLSLKILIVPNKCVGRTSLKKTHNKDKGKTSARFHTQADSSSYSLAADYMAVTNIYLRRSRQAEIGVGQGYCSAPGQDTAALAWCVGTGRSPSLRGHCRSHTHVFKLPSQK